MRIIGGKFKGTRILPPANLPVRPTTDLAKEALFNILVNRFDIQNLDILDLFSGTGNISLEFASRMANVTSVDKNSMCVKFLKQQSEKLGCTIKTNCVDVFNFLDLERQPYDLIFADPPFDLHRVTEIHHKVFEHKLLKTDGVLIIENPSLKSFANLNGFAEQRSYGNVSFNFFYNL